MTKDRIINATASVFRVSVTELLGPRRHANVAAARFAAAHALVVNANSGYEDVARLFRRTRSWATHAVWRCADRAEVDRQYSSQCCALVKAIGGAA